MATIAASRKFCQRPSFFNVLVTAASAACCQVGFKVVSTTKPPLAKTSAETCFGSSF